MIPLKLALLIPAAFNFPVESKLFDSDVILVPNPTYPIHAFGFIISGATIQHLPMQGGDDFFTVLDQAVATSHPKPKALVLNYPGNPTAEVVNVEFYKEIVAYAKKHEIAALELIEDGNYAPTAKQISARAGVGIRSFFRQF